MAFVINYARWLIVITGIVGCSTNQELPLLAISTKEESVALQRTPDVTSLNVTAVLRNDDARTLYVAGCFGETQKDISGVWTTVYAPICFGRRPHLTIVPGDSVVVPVSIQAFTTTPPTYPVLDPRMGPGRYRLLFGVDLEDPQQGSTDPKARRAVASTAFHVND